MATSNLLFSRYLKRNRKRNRNRKYLRADGASLVILLLLSRQFSDAFTVQQLYQAMTSVQQGLESNGILTSRDQITVNMGVQCLTQAAATYAANAQAGTSILPPFAMVTHIPLVQDYLSASSSKEEFVFRGTLVMLFYGVCGFTSCISADFSASIGPALTFFAQFMVANSCLLIFPQSYSLKRKLVCAFLFSGGAFRIVKLSLKSYKNLCKRLFHLGFQIGERIHNKFDSSTRPKLTIRKKNYLKVVFLAFNLENLIFLA